MSQEESNILYFEQIRKNLDFLLDTVKEMKNDHDMAVLNKGGLYNLKSHKVYPPMNTNCECHECTQARRSMLKGTIFY